MKSPELPEKTGKCPICGSQFDPLIEASLLEEAALLVDSADWEDAETLCQKCRKNRGELAMMYVVDR